jgi:hypothetical protein
MFYRISLYITTGIIDYKLNKMNRKSDHCFKTLAQVSTRFNQLYLEDYIGIFMIVISGYIICIICYFIEFILITKYKFIKIFTLPFISFVLNKINNKNY